MTAVFVDQTYEVHAEASPGLLPRLMQAFAKRNLTPAAVTARCEAGEMRVAVVVQAMPAEMTAVVAGNLGQVIGVLAVQSRP